MEFINTALEIYKDALDLTSRLSARYSRSFGPGIDALAGKLVEEVEIANSIYPSGEDAIRQRKYHLREARGALMALDVRLTMAFRVLLECPEGAFRKRRPHREDGSRGAPKPIPRTDALRRLDRMAEQTGLKIDRENDLLKGAIKALK